MALQTVAAVQSKFEEMKAYLQNRINRLRVGIIMVDTVGHPEPEKCSERRIRGLNFRTLRTSRNSWEEIVDQHCQGGICPAEFWRCPIAHTGTNKSQMHVLKSVFPVCGRGETVLVESVVDMRSHKEAKRALNLARDVSHGFATRRDGNGFGLNWGANTAQQMGGTPWAECEGPGQEVNFTLESPLKACETVGAVQPV
jgi:hypothetical protein